MNDSPLFNRVDEHITPLNFSEVEAKFLNEVAQAQDVSTIDKLIESMNETLRSQQLSEDEKAAVKRMRQRAYDRKRVLSKGVKVLPEQPLLLSEESHKAALEEAPRVFEEAQALLEEAPKALTRPSKARKPIVEVTPKSSVIEADKVEKVLSNRDALILGSAACFIAALVLLQTIPLYESSGFSDSVLTAIGALVIMISYPLYHAFSKSQFSLVLCFLACGYEIAFVYSGTHENERSVVQETVANNPNLKWLNAKVEKADLAYKEAKSRYDDPTDKKIFQNAWFRKTVVAPLWEDLEKAQTERMAAELELKNGVRASWLTAYLKVVYRLGLVVMCMLLVHRLAGFWRGGVSRPR